MEPKYKRLKYACYTGNLSMSLISNFSPLLFLTFHHMYGISYSRLGFLVLINFCTQLLVDLAFSFFSHKFNIPKTVKIMPLLTIGGFFIYACWPYVFPESVYIGLVIGTILFSAASGLSEVLLSPLIAEIPAKDPDREMSKLHSVYAWGTVGVVIVSSLFLSLIGTEHWQILTLLFLLIPLASVILFNTAEIPAMKTPERVTGVLKRFKTKSLWLCFFAIFLGGLAECTMSQWSSSFLEQAFDIPKIWGDIFGVALFAAMLGLGRTLYTKVGKNISRVLLLGAIGASVCYLTLAVSSAPIIGLICCALTGFCTSMLWPGCLIVGADRFPDDGVFIFAFMAAGGDLGASVGPQMVGVVTDFAIANPALITLAGKLGLAPEQFGMKAAMFLAALAPVAAIPLYAHIHRTKGRK